MRRLLLAALGVTSFALTFWYVFTRPRTPKPPSPHRPRPYTSGAPLWD